MNDKVKDIGNVGGISDIGTCPEPMPIDCLNEFPLAMAYVPMQIWRDLYDADVGFCRGTIFAELDLPFIGEEAVPNGK